MSRRTAWFRRIALSLLLVVTAATGQGCKKKEVAVETKVQKTEAKPLPPPHLLARGHLVEPSAFFDRVRANVSGSAALFFPSSVAAFLERGVRLDHRVGNEVDFARPIDLAWISVDKAPVLLLGMQLKDAQAAPRLLAESRKGEAQTGGQLFRAVKEGEPHYYTDANQVVLVLAKEAPKLDYHELLRFITVVTPTKGLFLHAEEEGLRDVVAPLLRSVWVNGRESLEVQADALKKEKARPADFGDPRAILDQADRIIQERIGAFGDLKSAELTLILDELSSLEAKLEPKEKPEGASATPAGLFEEPADSAVATFFRSSDAERATTKKRALEMFGTGGFKGPDAAKFATMTSDFLDGRGDELAISLHPPPYEGLFLRTKPKDTEKLEKSLAAFTDLATKSPLRDLLAKRFGEVSGVALGTQKADTGPVHVASFVAKTPFALAWAKTGEDEIAAFGPSATKLLEWGAKPARRLKDDFVLRPDERWATAPSSFALLFRRGATDPATTTNVRFAANYGIENAAYRLTIAADSKLVKTLVGMGL